MVRQANLKVKLHEDDDDDDDDDDDEVSLELTGSQCSSDRRAVAG